MNLGFRADGSAAAPVLVLLNSIGTTSAMWTPCRGPLAEQFRVVSIDLRGHGASAPSPAGSPSTVADLAGDVLETLDDLGVDQAHFAGVSLGGMLAMWIAAHRPSRVGRLAAACTSAHMPPAQNWLDRAAAVRTQGMAALSGLPARLWITAGLAQRDPELLAELEDMLASIDAESYGQCCEAIAGMDLRADLARIAAPTLVLAGADDPAAPVSAAEAIAAGIAAARLQVLADAAHIAPVEQPGAVTQALLAHFGAGASRQSGYATRRAVLGDQHVDNAIAATTELTAPFQDFLTRYAWGEVWSRPGLARRDRSIATLAALVSLGAEHEIAMHIRGALRNGLTSEEIAEVLLHTALYAGLPRANRAFAIARDVVEEETGS